MAAHPIAEANSPSTWNTIKQGAIDGVNWVGRQVQWLASTIKDYAIKVVEWAKPFFQTIGKFCVEQYDKVKELIVNNKEASLFAAALVAIVSIASIAGVYLFCNKDAQNKNGGDAAVSTT